MIRPQLAEGALRVGKRAVDEYENRIAARRRETIEPGLGSFQRRQRVGVELIDAALDVTVEMLDDRRRGQVRCRRDWHSVDDVNGGQDHVAERPAGGAAARPSLFE